MKSRRSRMYGDGRRSAASGLWSAASAQSCARVDGVATSHAERFARISRARTLPRRISSERTSQQARAPVDAPNMSIFDRPESVTTQSRQPGSANAGFTKESHVVEALVDRVVKDVGPVFDAHADELLDERAGIDAARRVVRVVQDDRSDPALREKPAESIGVGKELRRVRRELDDALARPLDEPVVLPARPRHDDAGAVLAEDLEDHREARARPGREEDLVRQKAHVGRRVVPEAVAVEELRDLAPDVHPADRGPVAVDRVARDPLRGPHDLGVRREVRVLVVALGQVERPLLLNPPRERAHERFGGREGAGREAPHGGVLPPPRGPETLSQNEASSPARMRRPGAGKPATSE